MVLFSLRCPTCGAKLDIAGKANEFTCQYCGNSYLLPQSVQNTPLADREHLDPLAVYTHRLQQWLKVGKYEICIHFISEEYFEDQRLLYANVEYRNSDTETLSCRRNQWILFDAEGYSYEAASKPALLEKRGRPALSERFVSRGMRVRGWIVFEIPPKIVLQRLQFLTGYLVTKTAEFLLHKS